MHLACHFFCLLIKPEVEDIECYYSLKLCISGTQRLYKETFQPSAEQEIRVLVLVRLSEWIIIHLNHHNQ